MSKENKIKTNAMRILDKAKVKYTVNYYNCEEFIDGMHIAKMLNQDEKMSFKTLVTTAKSGEHYVFVLPIGEEIDFKKAAKVAGEKSVEMVHVKDIKDLTGYIRGGCTAIGMKKRFPVFIDESALSFSQIIISGGALGVQIFLSPQDFLKVTGAKACDFLFKSSF